jgi:hypothetical protein
MVAMAGMRTIFVCGVLFLATLLPAIHGEEVSSNPTLMLRTDEQSFAVPVSSIQYATKSDEWIVLALSSVLIRFNPDPSGTSFVLLSDEDYTDLVFNAIVSRLNGYQEPSKQAAQESYRAIPKEKDPSAIRFHCLLLIWHESDFSCSEIKEQPFSAP